MASPQMYDNTGLENLKKAALSVKVRSFLNGGSGEIDPADLDNPELSLDLQALIDDPNFEVSEGLFPELMQNADKMSKGDYSQLTSSLGRQQNGHPQNGVLQTQLNGGQNGFGGRNPLAYMPQPVHFNNSGGNNPQQPAPDSSAMVVKEDPEGRMDYNGNAVSSTDQNYGYGGGAGSGSLSSVTSSSSSSNSPTSASGGSQGYSPNSYIHHHLTPATIGSASTNGNGDGHLSKSLGFHNKSLGGLHHHGHHHHGSGSSKKMKNVDKASDEYKRRRERNNIAVRKSREKAKVRTRETEERVKILAKENDRLQKKIDLLTEELTFLRSFFSNVGGLPEQIHREFNKHLETFQHHNIQNGIQLGKYI